MKVNKEVIIKNINAILCAFSVVGLVFPFCSMGAETSGEFASEAAESVTGLTLVTNGGMWGIIFIVAVVAIVAFNYVKQLCAYKKLGCLCGSALMTVATFLMSTASAAGADAAESPVSTVSSSIIEEKENSEYIMEKTEKLFEMKEKGILTEEEFAQKKSDLLEKM